MSPVNTSAGSYVHWTQHPKVRERLNLLVSGHPRIDRFQYFIQTYLHNRIPVNRALTLGCGVGDLERGLSQYNFASIHEGVDSDEAALAQATRLAAAAGLKNLRYAAANLNSIQVQRCSYDVIFGVMSVHHVTALERLFREVSDGLVPGGYFFLDEYVGPCQFQWRVEQLAAVNDQLTMLPDRFKACVNKTEMLKAPAGRPAVEEMHATAQAIRSTEILPLAAEFFEVAEVIGYGGTLLQPLLGNIMGNFAADDPEAMDRLQAIFDLEDELIASERLQHDFAVIIARKKTSFRTWVDYFQEKCRHPFR